VELGRLLIIGSRTKVITTRDRMGITIKITEMTPKREVEGNAFVSDMLASPLLINKR